MRITRGRVAAVLMGAAAAVCTVAAPAQAAIAPMTVTVDPVATINPGNTVTTTGTVTCPVGNTFYGYAKVRQPGRVPNAVVGTGLFFGPGNPVACTGAPQPWAVTTQPTGTGTFVPGAAEVQAVMSTQGPAGLNTVQVFVPVTLV
jgi:hypothetical protein